MNRALRAFLESIGLRTEATAPQAWRFYGDLGGETRARAQRIKTGRESFEPAGSDSGGSAGSGGSGDSGGGGQTAAEAVRAERERCAMIRELADGQIDPEVVQRAVDEGWPVERASQEFLRQLRDQRPAAVPVGGQAPGGTVRDHDRDCTRDVLVTGLLMRAGLHRIEREWSDQRRRQAEQLAERADRYRDLSMLEICRESIRLMGGREPLGRSDTVRTAIEMDRAAAMAQYMPITGVRSAGSGSTGSLSGIFTGLVNAQLLASYEEEEDTTRGWVRERDVPDFKPNPRTRMGKEATLKRLPRGGKAQHASPGDEKETYQAYRYSKTFKIDEQDIIDDDFNALLDWPEEMGMAAARVRPDLVYAILLANAALDADGVALFDASSHGNLVTGPGTALGAATVQVGISAIAKQTEDGVPLNMPTGFLIVPQDLVFTAQILLGSMERRDDTSTANGTLNPLRGLNIQPVADARIGTQGVVDPASGTSYAGTATNWFLSSRRPMIEVGYVRGTGRRPVIRPFTLTEGEWGLGWDVKHDVGAKALDYRGLYKNDGA